MEIKLTSTLNLKPLERYPFEIWFTFSKKRVEYYFTPSGKLKINVSMIDTIHLEGKMSDDDYKTIMSQMKKLKCDIITNEWENTFYTTGDKTLIELPNIIHLCDKALEEYKIRFK